MSQSNVNQENVTPEPFSRKLLKCFRQISIEPIMFLYMMAFMITHVLEVDLFYYKTCAVNCGYDPENCSKNIYEENREIQKKVTEFIQYNDIASHFIPVILALFMGNWSDRRGRKIPLLLGLISKFIYSIMIVVNALQPTWDVYMILYTATIPMSILGADIAIFAACFAYISDITTLNQRTLRITILDVIYLSTMPIGMELGLFLYNDVLKKSYASLFAINACLLLLSIIYTFVRLEWRTTSSQKPFAGKNVLADFFDKKHVTDTFKTLTKKRSGFGRLHVWLILFAMMFYTFQREESKNYLFFYTVFIFHWDVKSFSHFKTFKSIIFILCMLIVTPILSKVLKIRDTNIIAIGAMSHILGRIVFFFARNSTTFYIGAITSALGPIVAPVLRSMASKCVDQKERGKIFTLLSVFDNAMPIISGILYTQLYTATLQTMPNSFFLLTALSQFLVLSFILIIQCTVGQPTNGQPDVVENGNNEESNDPENTNYLPSCSPENVPEKQNDQT